MLMQNFQPQPRNRGEAGQQHFRKISIHFIYQNMQEITVINLQEKGRCPKLNKPIQFYTHMNSTISITQNYSVTASPSL